MEIQHSEVRLHPRYLDALFAFKKQVSNVFRDILSIHDIHHLSLARVDKHHELLSFSSTPAMEFNLFNSALWRYDGGYQYHWLQQGRQSNWQQLYQSERFDELYYLKQLKYGFCSTQSLAARIGEQYYLYSFASRNPSAAFGADSTIKKDELYKIGRYCVNLLEPYFDLCDQEVSEKLSGNYCYEVSN